MAAVFFLMFGAIGALSPFLSLFYKQAGLTATQISLLSSVTPFLIFVSQPLFGPLTDRSGHRGRMLGYLLLAVAATGGIVGLGHSFWTLLPLVALWSFFAGVLTPIGDSIALGEVVRTGVSYPQLRLWGSIGFLILTILMGRLYNVIPLWWAFPTYALFMVLAWVFARRLPAEGVSSRRDVWPALKGLLRNRTLLIFLLLSAVTWMTQAAHSTFYSVHLAVNGGTSAMVGFAWGLAASCEVPAWLVLGKLTRRTGPLPLLAFAAFVYSLRWWLYSVVTAPFLLVGMQVLQGLSFAMFMPTAVVFVGELTPPELRTSGQALIALVNSGVATIVGTMGAGWIVDRWNTAVLYRVCGSVALASGLGFLALLLALRVSRRRAAAA